MQNRPAFEIPYTEISNTNLAGKNEVAVEFALPTDGHANGANGRPDGSTKNRGRKAGAGADELVEMRFYIPGTVVKKEKEGDEENEGEEEEQNAANLFYETLMDKAEIGDVAGDTFATFLDVLHLTPRYALYQHLSMGLDDNKECAEVGSISICTSPLSGYVERRTTTRSSMLRSRSSSYYPRTTTPIRLSSWVSTLRSVRVKRDILSLSCS